MLLVTAAVILKFTNAQVHSGESNEQREEKA